MMDESDEHSESEFYYPSNEADEDNNNNGHGDVFPNSQDEIDRFVKEPVTVKIQSRRQEVT